jgi:SAM-dependent methyltransferase
MILRLAPRFARVDGVDISPEVLAVANRRCATLAHPPRLLLTPGDGLPEETAGCYDVAYSVICLQHICVHLVRQRIFEGLYRALKPGGVLTFQMGYAPGHGGRVDYFANVTQAEGTNGNVDVTILHPTELAGDLAGIGFVNLAYALTLTGPGDTHGAWIFFRAMKPGSNAAVSSSPAAWASGAFETVEASQTTMEVVRRRQHVRGIIARSRSADQLIERLFVEKAEAEQRATDAAARVAELEAPLSTGPV